MNIIGMYLLIINIVGFLLMGVDKVKAKAKAWRIPEKTIFIIAFLGGALGVWCGMYHFRHKTRHWYFKWGIPCIIVINILFLLEVLP